MTDPEISATGRIPGSFKDPSGFVYRTPEGLFRRINSVYLPTYESFMQSGLYDKLTSRGMLVKHIELPGQRIEGYKVIRPEEIPVVSYPFEWCFGQLKDAALLTLDIQECCIEHGFSLKDASAYNIQFQAGRPVFIDTLSFEEQKQDAPWIAYKQFCEHFLMPLALASYTDPQLLPIQRNFLNGIPLTVGVSMLPFRARLRPGLVAHLFLHAFFQKKHAASKLSGHTVGGMSSFKNRAMVDSLRSAIKGLTLSSRQTTWSDYYQDTNYSESAMTHKKALVLKMLERVAPQTVLDLGANTGTFSELAARGARYVISSDFDPLCVELNYQRLKTSRCDNVLPLIIDLMNPSPPLGWNLTERPSFKERCSSGLAMALALVHHLAIGQNLPFSLIADSMKDLAPYLLIEFVPKHDSQVQRLLANRKDIFADYNEQEFTHCFEQFFEILQREEIPDCARTIYLMKRRPSR